MKRTPQTEHHLYASNFPLSESSVERFLEYQWASTLCTGKKVLDFGCNTGYGMNLLAKNGSEVVGIDVVEQAIHVGKETFKHNPKLSFFLVNEGEMPFENGSFDRIVMLNIVEHFQDAGHYLKKSYDLLKPGGQLLITTVNRNLRLYPWQEPWNTLHTTEFSPTSLKKLLKIYFDDVDLYGLHHPGSFFTDYVGKASSLKFNTGIKWPLMKWGSKVKRSVLGQTTVAPPPTAHKQESAPKPSSKSTQEFDFDTAITHSEINQENLGICVKILAVAKKK